MCSVLLVLVGFVRFLLSLCLRGFCLLNTNDWKATRKRSIATVVVFLLFEALAGKMIERAVDKLACLF